jgi:hypothetical protein
MITRPADKEWNDVVELIEVTMLASFDLPRHESCQHPNLVWENFNSFLGTDQGGDNNLDLVLIEDVESGANRGLWRVKWEDGQEAYIITKND